MLKNHEITCEGGQQHMQYAESTLNRLHEVEFEILVEIDRVCKELKIEYFLDSGTALGAARHKGFIPWDDDIDLGMVRTEYDRFLEEAPTALSSEYTICTPFNTDGYAPMFAKIMKKNTKFRTQETTDSGFQQGIFVGVFPYDAVSLDPSTASLQSKKCGFWQRAMYLYCSGNTVVPHGGFLGACEKAACRIAHPILRRIYNPKDIVRNFEKWARAGEDNPSNMRMIYAYPYGEGFPEEVLTPTVTMQFEEGAFPGPANAEEYLSLAYGDWRTLPPEHQRRNHAPLELVFG